MCRSRASRLRIEEALGPGFPGFEDRVLGNTCGPDHYEYTVTKLEPCSVIWGRHQLDGIILYSQQQVLGSVQAEAIPHWFRDHHAASGIDRH